VTGCSRMTSRQAEVAATVHFATNELCAARIGPVSELDVFPAVQEWKGRRKPPLTDTEMASAIRNLAILGWLKVRPSPALAVPEAFRSSSLRRSGSRRMTTNAHGRR
jgi:hypothetical protein